MVTLVSITYQPIDEQYGENRFDHFIRVPFRKAILVEGHGIQGDQKAGRNPRRQINLLDTAWLAERRQQGFNAEPGAFGEQLIIAGLDVLSLETGQRLQIGEDAVIEITRPRTGCNRLEAAQGRSTADIEGPVGMLAMVVRTGTILVGDTIRVIVPEEVA